MENDMQLNDRTTNNSGDTGSIVESKKCFLIEFPVTGSQDDHDAIRAKHKDDYYHITYKLSGETKVIEATLEEFKEAIKL